MPPLYYKCKGCLSFKLIRTVNFKINQLRSLNIPTQWELKSNNKEEKPTSKIILKYIINVTSLNEKILPAKYFSKLRNN